jgi:hypothetical protein
MNTVLIQALVDELTKLAMAAPVAATAGKKAPFLIRNAKPIGYMALGAGLHSVGQDVVNDFRTGRTIRKQNEAAQNMY